MCGDGVEKGRSGTQWLVQRLRGIDIDINAVIKHYTYSGDITRTESTKDELRTRVSKDERNSR